MRLVIADADETATDPLVAGLRRQGAQVTVCADGAEALLQVGRSRPDVVLVGGRLPVVDASALVGTLRRRADAAVVFGVGAEDAAVAAEVLALGASACVARPYRTSEVLAILQASRRTPAAAESPADLHVGPVRLDPLAYEVWVDGRPVQLALREFELLEFLMRNADRAVSHEAIRAAVWGAEQTGDTNTVVVHVRRLRTKLGDDPRSPRLIRTIRGVGYRLCSGASAPGPQA
jgi:two-component system OmpR family response regulator